MAESQCIFPSLESSRGTVTHLLPNTNPLNWSETFKSGVAGRDFFKKQNPFIEQWIFTYCYREPSLLWFCKHWLMVSFSCIKPVLLGKVVSIMAAEDISPFCPALLTIKIWYLPPNKRASVEVVGTGTICQGTQEESWPPVHWIRGRQTSVWAKTWLRAVTCRGL